MFLTQRSVAAAALTLAGCAGGTETVPEEPVLYRSDAFTLTATSVEQGPFRAVAVGRDRIESGYQRAAVEHALGNLYRAAGLFLTDKENWVAETGHFEGTEVDPDRFQASAAALGLLLDGRLAGTLLMP